jgi:hypothetical protein
MRSFEEFGGVILGSLFGHAAREHASDLLDPILGSNLAGFGKSLLGLHCL